MVAEPIPSPRVNRARSVNAGLLTLSRMPKRRSRNNQCIVTVLTNLGLVLCKTSASRNVRRLLRGPGGSAGRQALQNRLPESAELAAPVATGVQELCKFPDFGVGWDFLEIKKTRSCDREFVMEQAMEPVYGGGASAIVPASLMACHRFAATRRILCCGGRDVFQKAKVGRLCSLRQND